MCKYGSIGITSIYFEPNKMITDNELGFVSFHIHGVPLLVPSSLTYPNLWLHNELDIKVQDNPYIVYTTKHMVKLIRFWYLSHTHVHKTLP